jgi:hypothetical protein
MASGILGFTSMAVRVDDIGAVSDALDDYSGIMEDTLRIFQETFPQAKEPSLGDSSRLPKRKGVPSPEELLEMLRFAVDIERINIENLLRDHPELPTDLQEGILRKAHHYIRLIGHYARWAKAAIQRRYPGFWTDIHEAEFKKYLEIGPATY